MNQSGLEDLQQRFPYHSQGEGMYYRPQMKNLRKEPDSMRADDPSYDDPSSCNPSGCDPSDCDTSSCYPANCDYPSCAGACSEKKK